MKKGFVAGAVLLISLVSTAMAEIRVDGYVYAGVFDKYLWRGYNLSENSAVAQGGLDLMCGSFTLGYWSNSQFQDDAGFQGGDISETDITLDYALDLGDMVTLNFGNSIYVIEGRNDTNEAYVAATVNTLLAPKLTVYYDWDENKDSRAYTLEIGHSLAFGLVTLNAGALASYLEGTDRYAKIETNVPWNAELFLSADVAVTEQITVIPSFVYSAPLSDDAQAIIDTEMASGLTVTLNF